MKYLFILFAILFAACSDENIFDEAIETSEDEYDDYRSCDYKEKYDSWCCNNYNMTCNKPKYTRYECSSTSYYYDYNSDCCADYGLLCQSSSSGYTYSEYECNLGYGTDYKCCSYYGVRCYTYSSSSYYNYYSSSSSGYTYTKYECEQGYGTNAKCCSYYDVRCEYTTKSRSMQLELTKYAQVTSNWDGLNNAGDPRISFTVKFYDQYDNLIRSTSTGILLSQDDVRNWSGSKTAKLTVPTDTYEILVCPSVIDKDVTSDDNMSSGYCYSVSKIGTLANNVVQSQSDYNSSKYNLYWNWYLF